MTSSTFRVVGLAPLVIAGVIIGLPGARAEDGGSAWLRSHASGGGVEVSGTKDTGGASDSGATTSDGRTYATQRVAQRTCGTLNAESDGTQMCVDGAASTTVTRICADGSTALDPLFRREVDPTTHLFIGPWTQVDNGGCPEDPDPTIIVTATDLQRLPIAPSTPQIQPADGQGLVNIDLIVYTDPAPQTLTTTILGTPVTVQVTPTRWSWDYGDDTEPLVTTDPGQPYPHHTVARPYNPTRHLPADPDHHLDRHLPGQQHRPLAHRQRHSPHHLHPPDHPRLRSPHHPGQRVRDLTSRTQRPSGRHAGCA